MGGEVEQILLHLGGGWQLGEILCGNEDMAGRAGHLPLARPFERLAGGLADIEQSRTRRGVYLCGKRACRIEEAHPRHAANAG